MLFSAQELIRLRTQSGDLAEKNGILRKFGKFTPSPTVDFERK